MATTRSSSLRHWYYGFESCRNFCLEIRSHFTWIKSLPVNRFPLRCSIGDFAEGDLITMADDHDLLLALQNETSLSLVVITEGGETCSLRKCVCFQFLPLLLRHISLSSDANPLLKRRLFCNMKVALWCCPSLTSVLSNILPRYRRCCTTFKGAL